MDRVADHAAIDAGLLMGFQEVLDGQGCGIAPTALLGQFGRIDMGVPVDDHGGVSLSDKKYLKVYIALKSCQVGLTDSIRAIFFARSHL
jgi:hypothetical protein